MVIRANVRGGKFEFERGIIGVDHQNQPQRAEQMACVENLVAYFSVSFLISLLAWPRPLSAYLSLSVFLSRATAYELLRRAIEAIAISEPRVMKIRQIDRLAYELSPEIVNFGQSEMKILKVRI